MCGIYLSISKTEPPLPTREHEERLRARGPDSVKSVQTRIITSDGTLDCFALSTVLSMRGNHITSQPLVFDHAEQGTQSILCWNGEAYSVAGTPVVGDDASVVFAKLLEASANDAVLKPVDKTDYVSDVLRDVQGPYAFVFLDGLSDHLFFGRDCLGRRSLLIREYENALILSSISDPADSGWLEVEVDAGPLSVDRNPRILAVCHNIAAFNNTVRQVNLRQLFKLTDTMPDPTTVKLSLPEDGEKWSHPVSEIESHLRRSISTRVNALKPSRKDHMGHLRPRIAVLFSGGLDCTLIARFIHDLIPLDEPVDLLNVAFENPRIHKAETPLETGKSFYDLCPDRITALSSHAELSATCPGRAWNLVKIDVPFTETNTHRAAVASLMSPNDTEMDLSIALALYFAARGTGQLHKGRSELDYEYTTPARVLMSGLGADELFGGYTRHATAFSRGGHKALINELSLDVSRLGKRNLGRDDRVLSHWSREARFPYLDESFVDWAVALPIWYKVGFGLIQSSNAGSDVTADLEDGKLVLRLLAHRLGLPLVAREKKRAIQFGARTAKMHSGKSRGTDAIA